MGSMGLAFRALTATEKLSRKGRRFGIRFLGTKNWQYCVEAREKLRHTRLEAAGIQPFAGRGQGLVVVDLVSRLDGAASPIGGP